MAKRRRTTTKTKTRVVYRTKKRKNNKDKGMFNLSGIMTPLASIGYGFARERVSDMIAQSNLGKRLPVTQFTDEGVMLALLWGTNKIIKPKGLFGSIMRAGKIVEYSRIGSTIDQVYTRKMINSNNSVRLG